MGRFCFIFLASFFLIFKLLWAGCWCLLLRWNTVSTMPSWLNRATISIYITRTPNRNTLPSSTWNINKEINRNLTMFASTLFPIWRSMEREGRAVDWYQWTLRARNDGMPKLLLQAKLVSVFTENSLKILTDTYWYFRPPSDFYQWFDPLLVELNSSTMHYIYFQNLSKSVWIFRLPK